MNKEELEAFAREAASLNSTHRVIRKKQKLFPFDDQGHVDLVSPG